MPLAETFPENIQQLKASLALQEELYLPTLKQAGQMDSAPIHLYRYQLDPSSLSLDGPHFSIVVSGQGTLLGFTRINPSLAKPLQITKEEAEIKAQTFLTLYAPDLLEHQTLQWVDAHDEAVLTPEGETLTLTGMKVKFRDAKTGLYFWVIVAHDASIMIFERDIYWDFEKSGRRTEKWLHDSWLKHQVTTS